MPDKSPAHMASARMVTFAVHHRRCLWATFLGCCIVGASATMLRHWWKSVGVGVSLGHQQPHAWLELLGWGGAHWRGNGNVRALVLARSCWTRGEDATINIRWEVGWGHFTKREGKVGIGRRPAIHCASANYCDCAVSVHCDYTTIHCTAAAFHCNRHLCQLLRAQA